MPTTLTVSELWEDEHFSYWESFEDRYREPIEDSQAKFDEVSGVEEAREWLIANDIDPDKLPFQPKLLHVSASRDYDLAHIADPCGRTIIEYDGLRERDTLVFPIVDNGQTIDFGLLHVDDFEFATVRQKAIWLGGYNIDGDEVRLHSCVSDWLEAGATGCVYIDAQRRTPLKRLNAVKKILCNNVALALEAWDWAFGADDAELDRFEIDDDQENINAYFQAQAERRAMSEALNAKHPGRFNVVAA